MTKTTAASVHPEARNLGMLSVGGEPLVDPGDAGMIERGEHFGLALKPEKTIRMAAKISGTILSA
jgi:hypothetical protein